MIRVAYLLSLTNQRTGRGLYRRRLLEALRGREVEQRLTVDVFSPRNKIAKVARSAVLDVNRYDVVHCEEDIHWYWGLLLRRAVDFSRVRLAVTLHGIMPRIYPEYASGRQKLRLSIIKRLTPVIDGIYTVSQAEKRLIARELGYDTDSIFVTYNGVDELRDNHERVEDVLPDWVMKRGYILHVSNGCKPMKQPELLLDIYAEVTRRSGGVALVVVGRGWDGERARDLAIRRGIENDVWFTGEVERNMLGALYREAEIYLQTSKRETFCLPIVEAMQCGTLVVTTRAHAVPEIAKDGAVYIEDDVEKAAEKICDILTNGDAYRRVQARGQYIADKYSWSRTAAATISGYRKMVRDS